MNRNIVAICENEESAKLLQKACGELDFNASIEIQCKGSIKNELSQNDIENASIVLFVISYEVEEIENIERFIDREYYEVEPQFVINDAKSVMNEIASELN